MKCTYLYIILPTFGILGMIIGVPIFAVTIHVINSYTMNALRKKGLRTSLNEYYVGDPKNIDSSKLSFKQKIKLLFLSSKTKNNKGDKNQEE